jgi:dTDP-4-dehydrorhamnose reductase
MKTFLQLIKILEAKSEQEHYQDVFKGEFSKSREGGKSIEDSEKAARQTARRAKIRRTSRLAERKWRTDLRDEPQKWRDMVKAFGEFRYT